MDCEQLAEKIILKTFTPKKEEHILKDLTDYYYQPREIEARLSQWIFFLIKGHSFESIRSFEKRIFGKKHYSKDPEENYLEVKNMLKENNEKIKNKKRELDFRRKKSEEFRKQNMINEFVKESELVQQIRNEIEDLERTSMMLENVSKQLKIASFYFKKMSVEAVRVANLFRKKYSRLTESM
jgi:hypothetical protein